MMLVYFFALVALLAALLGLRKPNAQLNWKPDFARQARGDIVGNTLTISDVRRTRYFAPKHSDLEDSAPGDSAPRQPYEVRWDTTSYDLSKLKRLWFVIESFSKIKAVAHTFLSFEFEDGTCLAVSVEARQEVEEDYDIVDGILRRFELCYLFGDEEDMILRRTRYLQHQVYLYPLVTPPEEIRKVLERMVGTANALAEQPRFYNSILDNCTSVLRKHANEVRPGSFRAFALSQVLPGTSDHMLYKKGWIKTQVPIDNLREHYAIKEISEDCAEERDFSSCIRSALEG